MPDICMKQNPMWGLTKNCWGTRTQKTLRFTHRWAKKVCRKLETHFMNWKKFINLINQIKICCSFESKDKTQHYSVYSSKYGNKALYSSVYKRVSKNWKTA